MPLFRRLRRLSRARRTASTDTPSPVGIEEKPDVGFVACIEGGVLEAQALLLFESIRRYAGRFRDYSLYALSPRAGRVTREQPHPGLPARQDSARECSPNRWQAFLSDQA